MPFVVDGAACEASVRRADEFVLIPLPFLASDHGLFPGALQLRALFGGGFGLSWNLDRVRQSDQRQGTDAKIGEVNLPPAHSVSSRGLVGMVVVVPAFAVGHRG